MEEFLECLEVCISKRSRWDERVLRNLIDGLQVGINLSITMKSDLDNLPAMASLYAAAEAASRDGRERK